MNDSKTMVSHSIPTEATPVRVSLRDVILSMKVTELRYFNFSFVAPFRKVWFISESKAYMVALVNPHCLTSSLQSRIEGEASAGIGARNLL